MKIVSINLEGTDKLVSAELSTDKPPHGVAFNLDRPLSPDAQKKLKSRLSQTSLSIEVNESCLCLTVTTKGEPIDSATVNVINSILNTIEKEEKYFLQKRKDVLQTIAEKTQLEFDTPLKSLQR